MKGQVFEEALERPVEGSIFARSVCFRYGDGYEIQCVVFPGYKQLRIQHQLCARQYGSGESLQLRCNLGWKIDSGPLHRAQ
jgi:hypothetical protein